MPFDPEKYLTEQKTSSFDPAKYLAENKTSGFDPAKYLAESSSLPEQATTADLIKLRRGERPTPAPAKPVVGRTVTPATGVVPYEPTSEFAGMEMEEEKRVPMYTFDDLWQRDDLFSIIQDYAKARGGKEFKGDITDVKAARAATTADLIAKRKGEVPAQTRQEFVADWMQSMREKELNVLLAALPELNYLRNATPDQAATVALAHKVYQETAGVTEKGGQTGFRPYGDTIKALATDPLNYLGFIFGKGTGVAISKTTSEAIKKAAITGTAVTTEALVGGAGDIVDQRIQQEVSKAAGEKVDELNPWRIGAAMILSGATAGYGAGKVATRPKPTEGFLKEELKKRAEEVIPQTPTSPVTSLEKKLIDPVNQQIDEEVSRFMKAEGAKILDQFGPTSALMDAKVATELSGRAVRVALRVIQDDPQFMVKPSQKTSDAIARVFSSLDTIDDAVLERAIRAEGLTPADFAAANKMTVSDAARVMQQYSEASKLMSRLRGADPEFNKQMKELYDETDEPMGVFQRGIEVVKAVERESKAWITSGIDTTMRNVAGTSIGLTAKAGSDIMEGFIYSLGVVGKDIVTGKGVKAGTQRAMKSFAGSIQDATRTLVYMKKNGLAGEVTDTLLEHSPALRSNLLSALQETSNKDISRIGKIANTFNTAQDVFFRRAIFTASVETQLRRQGMDMYAMIADNKLIPTEILSRAVDDALKASFSYMPKPGKKGIEGAAESGANQIIRLIEKTPFTSLAVPFPRFMANAMAFQYRYSPLGAAGTLSDYSTALRASKSGDTAKATEYIRRGNLKGAQALVGIGALMAAYDYRKNNLDTEWYNVKNEDGSTTDIRAVFPLAPYFAVADLYARFEQGVPLKTAEAYQAIVGMKMPAGSQNVIMDQFIAAASTDKEAENWAINSGKIIGDFFGRFTQPFVVKSFYDLYDLINEEGAVARDPNVLDTSGTAAEQALQAAKQRVQAKIPGWKEGLPEAVPRLREEPIVREGQFFNRLVGFRKEPEKNPIEREVARLNLDAWRLYGSPSGDKEFDRMYIAEANKQVEQRVAGVLKNKSYQALSPLKQRTALVTVINESTARAKKIVSGQYKAADLQKIYKNKYNRLPQERRMLINEMYAEEHDGVTLEDAKDYMAVDIYEKKIKGELRLAVGGSVGKAALKGLFKSAGKKTSADLMREMQEKAALKSMPAVEPVAKEIPAPLAKQTEEALPPPPTIQAAGLAKYDPAIVSAAEQKAKDMQGSFAMDELKKSFPEEYENTVFLHMDDSTGTEMPYPNKGSVYDFIDEEGNIDFTAAQAEKVKAESQSAVEKQSLVPIEEEPVIVSNKALAGEIKDIATIPERESLLNQIREERTQSFRKLSVLPEMKKVEDTVIGVTQGDFRAANKKEVDLTNPKDVAAFVSLAEKNQKKLDKLRVKYKNTPPIELFHGTVRAADTVAAEGFAKPQTFRKKHAELDVGGPSFTTDVSLQFNTGEFGGRMPESFVSTKMPYAEYVFGRVNMPYEAYIKNDLDIIAQTISGDPTSTRALGLPRGHFNEQESVFVEADKLMVNKSSKEVKQKLKAFEEKESKIKAAERDYTSNLISWYSATSKDAAKKRILANKLYKNIRQLFQQYGSASEVPSTKVGIGQQYSATLSKASETVVKPDMLDLLAEYLEMVGSKERADTLKTLSSQLRDLKEKQIKDGKSKIPAEILKTTSKLATGGLASRR